MRLKKRYIALVLVALFLMPTMGMASASENTIEEYVPNTSSEKIILNDINDYVVINDNESTAIVNASASMGHCTITRINATQARISGTTASPKKNNIKVVVALQYYKNGKWISYPGASNSASTFGTTTTASGVFTITKGYSYRVVGNHVAGSKTYQSVSGSLSF